MKKILFFLSLMFVVVGIATAQSGKSAVISSDKVEHDFGVILEANGKVSHTFVIKNTGNVPLAITRVVAACGCTVPEYSSAPIAPGAESKVKVTFDPAGRPGPFVKSIAIYSNGKDGSFSLRIKGEVK